MTEEQRARRRERERAYRQQLKEEREAAVIERRTGIRPETTREQRERFEREDAEMRALGISYGKYQLLKSQGRLPKNIRIEPKPKREKKPKQSSEEKNRVDYDSFRANQLLIMAAQAADEARQKKAILQKGDSAVARYMAAQKKYKEAINRGGGE